MNYNNSFKGEKLVGRSNITEWFTNASLYLEINGYMPYIDGTENPHLNRFILAGKLLNQQISKYVTTRD